jgi:uncharacterized cupredoxin-like copper-binding protein
MRTLATFSALVTASLLLLACGGGGSDDVTPVAVTLEEWEISTDPIEVSPGDVKFSVTNSGTKQHQFVIVKSDLPPGQLPTTDVSVDETKVNISGSIESLAPGESGELELELFPGKYVFICNLVDQIPGGPADPHYLNGMAASFLVLDD